jgi:hypothetical protein
LIRLLAKKISLERNARPRQLAGNAHQKGGQAQIIIFNAIFIVLSRLFHHSFYAL